MVQESDRDKIQLFFFYFQKNLKILGHSLLEFNQLCILLPIYHANSHKIRSQWPPLLNYTQFFGLKSHELVRKTLSNFSQVSRPQLSLTKRMQLYRVTAFLKGEGQTLFQRFTQVLITKTAN